MLQQSAGVCFAGGVVGRDWYVWFRETDMDSATIRA